MEGGGSMRRRDWREEGVSGGGGVHRMGGRRRGWREEGV